jgi:steroid 5-alpha reductase family enzyme
MSTFLFSLVPYLPLFLLGGFILSVVLKRNDIADVMWGPGILLSSILVSHANVKLSLTILVALLILALWALRICLHIGTRFVEKREEDARYRVWRETWMWFYTRSFFQVFLLQGALMVVMSTLLWQTSMNAEEGGLTPWALSGFVIAGFGLIYETVADLQLRVFLKEKTGGIMKRGLWKLSRHPNYFGEMVFWWGMFFAFIPQFFGGEYHLILAPLTITFLLTRVSGVPMLEARYKGNAEFDAYKNSTPAIVPRLWR